MSVLNQLFIFASCLLIVLSCSRINASLLGQKRVPIALETLPKQVKLVTEAAQNQIGKTLFYDPSYATLDYPLGDVPIIKGVCTDVVIRSLRAVDLDLQQLVHEDMKAHFSKYPKNWGLKKPDKNIDHRRVPNLNTFFTRKGWSLPISKKLENYLPGDIISWKLSNGRDHIGVVSSTMLEKTKTPLVIHNIGLGAVKENVLFDWKIVGHFRIKFKKDSE